MSRHLYSRAVAARLNSMRSSMEDQLGLIAFAVLFVLVLIQPAAAQSVKAGSLTIESPWTRATPAGAKVAGGYVTLRSSGQADRLIGASADIAGRTEIHEMALKDGIMTMRQLANGLATPAQGQVELKPGSFHMMFLDLKRPLKDGETVAGTLMFEKAGTVPVTFAVRSMGATSGHDPAMAH